MIVVDANLLASLAIPLEYSKQTTQRMEDWKRAGIDLLAPVLCEYELYLTLRKAVVNRILSAEEALVCLKNFPALGVRMIAPSYELHRLALQWAGQIKQPVAYDAQYLAVAEQFRAELWTADRRLADAAQQAGASWAHWIGE